MNGRVQTEDVEGPIPESRYDETAGTGVPETRRPDVSETPTRSGSEWRAGPREGDRP